MKFDLDNRTKRTKNVRPRSVVEGQAVPAGQLQTKISSGRPGGTSRTTSDQDQ